MDYSEGDACPHEDCSGTLIIRPVENCCCHIVQPCGQCTSNPLLCNECLEEVE